MIQREHFTSREKTNFRYLSNIIVLSTYYAVIALQHSDGSSSHSPLLISFIGDSGVLASATVGEKAIDIWDPPPTEPNKVVMKPKSSIPFDDENIVRYNVIVTYDNL